MDVRRKRALLAVIDGQLAAMDRTGSNASLRWRRIGEAMRYLRAMPRDAFEDRRLEQLREHITASAPVAGRGVDTWTLAQRRTLARADCVLWQMHLRRRNARRPAALRYVPWLASSLENPVDGL